MVGEMNNKHNIKMKKCKACCKKLALFNSLAQVCSIDCAIQYAKDNKVQERVRRQLAKIAKEKIKTRSEHLKEAQAAFNAFIRERDKSEPCISCERYHKGQYHAGIIEVWEHVQSYDFVSLMYISCVQHVTIINRGTSLNTELI